LEPLVYIAGVLKGALRFLINSYLSKKKIIKTQSGAIQVHKSIQEKHLTKKKKKKNHQENHKK
jgi:hypothetical protein